MTSRHARCSDLAWLLRKQLPSLLMVVPSHRHLRFLARCDILVCWQQQFLPLSQTAQNGILQRARPGHHDHAAAMGPVYVLSSWRRLVPASLSFFLLLPPPPSLSRLLFSMAWDRRRTQRRNVCLVWRAVCAASVPASTNDCTLARSYEVSDSPMVPSRHSLPPRSGRNCQQHTDHTPGHMLSWAMAPRTLQYELRQQALDRRRMRRGLGPT